ncbi:MAG: bifunctional folylpolyglutamate synthase/dihydrofolate synthase [Nitrospiraceae bacterium]|nr:MAG: bifunctional folylpolyglutamate synthase/dihydrofolate synthase [Nitrospiraceae bacterium]
MTADFNKYDSTVNYLYRLQKHGIKLGLSNIKELMDRLGSPHRSFRSIHIAGTNGKGSTAAAIASILHESGFKVGLFTSPHLVSFTERIRIDNQPITERDVIETASMLHDLIAGTELNPTFFEVVTAMAFSYFAQNSIDWAVVETGMGGRLDATNIISPDVSIITNISLDHCEFLGSGISDITFEKAGIIKPGIPVITSSGRPEVVKQLSDIAESRGAELHVYNRDFRGSLLQMDERRITFNYAGYGNFSDLTMSLAGRYQLYNACTAVRACEILRDKGHPVSDESIKKGLSNINLEGRLEWISGSPPVVIDGAHNPEAAGSLAASVKEIFPDKKIILIAGIMDDKDIFGVLRPLVLISDLVVLTRPGYERAASLEKLEKNLLAVKESDADTSAMVITAATVGEALDIAKKNCRNDNIILVTGSFYTTGEVKELTGSKGVLTALREQVRGEEAK